MSRACSTAADDEDASEEFAEKWCGSAGSDGASVNLDAFSANGGTSERCAGGGTNA